MSAENLPAEGSCRCGQVRVRVSAPPMLSMVCHCRGCQKMTASAFALTATFAAEAFEVIAGEPVIGGLHGPQAHHYHCPHCMSWVFTRAEGMDWFVNLRPTMLDPVRWSQPLGELWTSEKLPWVDLRLPHSFPEMPTMEQFGELTREYRASGLD